MPSRVFLFFSLAQFAFRKFHSESLTQITARIRPLLRAVPPPIGLAVCKCGSASYHHNVGVAGGGKSSWNQLIFAYTNISSDPWAEILGPESSSCAEIKTVNSCHANTGHTTDVAGSVRHNFGASMRHPFWNTIRINVISERWVVDPFHPKRLLLWMMLTTPMSFRRQRRPSVLRTATTSGLTILGTVAWSRKIPISNLCANSAPISIHAADFVINFCPLVIPALQKTDQTTSVNVPLVATSSLTHVRRVSLLVSQSLLSAGEKTLKVPDVSSWLVQRQGSVCRGSKAAAEADWSSLNTLDYPPRLRCIQG